MVRFTGNYSLFTPASPFAAMIQEAIWRGVGHVVRVGGNGVFTMAGHTELLLSTYLAMAAHVSIEGYPFYILVPYANYDDDVPAYMPNRLDANDLVRSWSQYTDGSHVHGDTDTHYVVAGNSFGEELDSSVALQLHGDGFTLWDTALYITNMSSGDPDA